MTRSEAPDQQLIENVYAAGQEAYEQAVAVRDGAALDPQRIRAVDALRLRLRDLSEEVAAKNIQEPSVRQAMSEGLVDAEYARSGGAAGMSRRLAQS